MAERLDPPDHAERLAAAQRAAQWHLGDETWADMFVEAYRDPDVAHASMDEEGVPE